jgi:hypothetical protein
MGSFSSRLDINGVNSMIWKQKDHDSKKQTVTLENYTSYAQSQSGRLDPGFSGRGLSSGPRFIVSPERQLQSALSLGCCSQLRKGRHQVIEEQSESNMGYLKWLNDETKNKRQELRSSVK